LSFLSLRAFACSSCTSLWEFSTDLTHKFDREPRFPVEMSPTKPSVQCSAIRAFNTLHRTPDPVPGKAAGFSVDANVYAHSANVYVRTAVARSVNELVFTVHHGSTTLMFTSSFDLFTRRRGGVGKTAVAVSLAGEERRWVLLFTLCSKVRENEKILSFHFA